MELILKAVKSLVSGINAKLEEIKKIADNAAKTADENKGIFYVNLSEDADEKITLKNSEDVEKIYEKAANNKMVVAKLIRYTVADGTYELYLPFMGYLKSTFVGKVSENFFFGGIDSGSATSILINKIDDKITIEMSSSAIQ